jgi:hypothetical protein
MDSYNSLVFTSLSANEYRAAIVTEDFLTGAPMNVSEWINPYTRPDPTPAWNMLQKNVSNYEKISNEECIKTYSEAFQGSRRNVVLVSSDKNDTNSVLWIDSVGENTLTYYDWGFWICSTGADSPTSACNPAPILADAASWVVFDHPIQYCMTEVTPNICSLQFSFDIMIVVLICNAIKVLCMLFILYFFEAEHLLTAVGDVIASFMQQEDPNTVSMCLADKRHLARFWNQNNLAKPYNQVPGRWWRASSIKRWLAFTSLWVPPSYRNITRC